MLEESEEKLNSKDDAQASLAIKKIVCQKRPPATRELDIISPTTHLEKKFTSLGSRTVEDFTTSFSKLVISVVQDLRNNKAPGLDWLSSEDIKEDPRKPS